MAIDDREVTDEFRQAQSRGGGRQLGGGPEAADQDAAGGSSGAGGYGNAQNQSLREGRADAPQKSREISRGERFDNEQGGGRGDDSLDSDDNLDDDERALHDEGQKFIDRQERGGPA